MTLQEDKNWGQGRPKGDSKPNRQIVTLESKGSICSFVSKWIRDIYLLTKKQMSRIHFKKKITEGIFWL